MGEANHFNDTEPMVPNRAAVPPTAPAADPRGRAIVIGAVAWLVLCIGAGIVALIRLGSYGSILQPLVGAAAGACGATSHAILCLFPRFGALGALRRAVENWLCAYLSFAALVILLTNFRIAQYNPKFWADASRFMILYTGGPMFLAALLVAWLTGTGQRTRAGKPSR